MNFAVTIGAQQVALIEFSLNFLPRPGRKMTFGQRKLFLRWVPMMKMKYIKTPVVATTNTLAPLVHNSTCFHFLAVLSTGKSVLTRSTTKSFRVQRFLNSFFATFRARYQRSCSPLNHICSRLRLCMMLPVAKHTTKSTRLAGTERNSFIITFRILTLHFGLVS
jgi:hypothetical protein